MFATTKKIAFLCLFQKPFSKCSLVLSYTVHIYKSIFVVEMWCNGDETDATLRRFYATLVWNRVCAIQSWGKGCPFSSGDRILPEIFTFLENVFRSDNVSTLNQHVFKENIKFKVDFYQIFAIFRDCSLVIFSLFFGFFSAVLSVGHVWIQGFRLPFCIRMRDCLCCSFPCLRPHVSRRTRFSRNCSTPRRVSAD